MYVSLDKIFSLSTNSFLVIPWLPFHSLFYYLHVKLRCLCLLLLDLLCIIFPLSLAFLLYLRRKSPFCFVLFWILLQFWVLLYLIEILKAFVPLSLPLPPSRTCLDHIITVSMVFRSNSKGQSEWLPHWRQIWFKSHLVQALCPWASHLATQNAIFPFWKQW